MKERCELQSYGHKGRERKRARMANIIELKRWSRAISTQVGEWRVRKSRRDINF